jgi:hypothetical protein
VLAEEQIAFVAAVREPILRDPGRKTAKVDADQVLTDWAQVAFLQSLDFE